MAHNMSHMAYICVIYEGWVLKMQDGQYTIFKVINTPLIVQGSLTYLHLRFLSKIRPFWVFFLSPFHNFMQLKTLYYVSDIHTGGARGQKLFFASSSLPFTLLVL